MSESVSKSVPKPKPSQRAYGKNYKLIGKNYQTADMLAKVTGKAKYAEDFPAEGMLFCRLVLSPVPNARIKHIDTEKAMAIPGVKAILTADDIPAQADSMDAPSSAAPRATESTKRVFLGDIMSVDPSSVGFADEPDPARCRRSFDGWRNWLQG